MWHIDSVSLKISTLCVRGVCEGQGAGGCEESLEKSAKFFSLFFYYFFPPFLLWRCDVNKDLLKICRPTHIIHMFYLLGLNSFWLPTNKRKSWEKQQEISCTNICKSISNRYFSGGIFSPARTFNLHNLPGRNYCLRFCYKEEHISPSPTLSFSFLI